MKHAYTIIADLHTHTLFSGHAHSTFSEMVAPPGTKGLYALAVTDHTGVMPGSPVDWYFSSLHELPLHYKGVLTIVGAETNILDFEGNTDLGESYAGQLDWVVASIHRLGLPGLENPDVEKCTHLWSQIAKNPPGEHHRPQRRSPLRLRLREGHPPVWGEPQAGGDQQPQL